ncbi:HNH endonuclease signature motif containing protein [Streptomyces sp. OM5714]|uniref:HNH endonuclease n=1 Tax=Streptomyces sp. OM5714 TaxID=2602736 RepID=UPI0013DAF7EF|nr:HNH endonuclease signature motif containing protein [Streptomyces sp. OM5714]
MRTRCINAASAKCGGWVEYGHGSRCRACESEYRARKNATNRGVRKQRLATGDGAQRRVRAALNRAGAASCAKCRRSFLATDLAVDHVHALSKGGKDVMSNVQVLCHECHRLKTRSERTGGG